MNRDLRRVEINARVCVGTKRGRNILGRCFLRSALLAVILTAVCPVSLEAGGLNSLSLSSPTLDGLDANGVEVRMSSLTVVEGFTLAIAFDVNHVSAIDFEVTGVATPAEFSASSLFNASGGATLSAIMDADPPFGGNLIPAGDDQLIALLTLRAAGVVGTSTTTAIEFSDGSFGSPPVTNAIIVAQVPIDASQGLGLSNGTVTCLPPPQDFLSIEDTVLVSGESGPVRVLMTNNSGPVEGFSVAVAHSAAELQLDGIDLLNTVTDAALPDFISTDLSPQGGTGGTVTVAIDLTAPFSGATIPTGVDQPIVNFVYTPIVDLVEGQDSAETYALALVNNALGQPTVSNSLVVAGVGIVPALLDGVVTAEPHPVLPDLGVKLYCGQRDLELDALGNPISGPVLGGRGDKIEICISYTSDTFNIQGFQLALCLDCELQVCDFSVDNTIAGELGTEFLAWQFDTLQDDGDGCEFVAGLLLDVLPPFDRQTLPPTTDPLAIACLEVEIADEPVCRSAPGNLGSGINFYCGPPGLTLDGEGNPVPAVVEAVPGEAVELCFYYTSEYLEIAGFQLAICYDCDLTVGPFMTDGSALDQYDAEFVNFNLDNDPNDGDGCELVVGVLMDVFPPFDGQTVPVSTVPLQIGCVDAVVNADAPCEDLLTVDFCDFVDGAGMVPIQNIAIVGVDGIQDIGKFCCAIRVRTNPSGGLCDKLGLEFCNDIDGNGVVLIENLVVIDNQGIQDVPTCGCEVCLLRIPEFQRGDCNQDEKANISDANTILAVAYQGFTPDCADACDINDDGFINLADSVYLLNFVFGFGFNFPAPTHPTCGPDPTVDELGCLTSIYCTF